MVLGEGEDTWWLSNMSFFVGRTAARLLLCSLSAPLFIFFVVFPQGVPMWEALGKRTSLSPDGKLRAARGGGRDEDGDACDATCGKRGGGRTRRLRPRPCVFERAEALLLCRP